MLKKEGLDKLVTQFLGLDAPAPKLDEWEEVVHRLLNPKHKVRIGMVGKYMDLQDSYLSVNESSVYGGIRNDYEVEVIHIDAEDIEKDGPEAHLERSQWYFGAWWIRRPRNRRKSTRLEIRP